MASSTTGRYILHSSPRSASSAFARILNIKAHYNVTPETSEGYFLLPFFMYIQRQSLSSRPANTWTEAEKSKLRQTLKECYSTLKMYLDEADSKGHKVYIKEHSDFFTDPTFLLDLIAGGNATELNMNIQSIVRDIAPDLTGKSQTWSEGNYTIFPDEFLATWKPTFLIRHPAVMLPSQARAFPKLLNLDGNLPEKQAEVIHTLRWARSLYELYRDVLFVDSKPSNNSTQWPVVLNSAEVLSDPKLLKKYCDLIGFEEDKLKLSWDPLEEGSDGKKSSVMNVSLDASNGIMKEKIVTSVNIDDEVPKWIEEFGVEYGRRMEKWVRDAMPDYEFLMERRLKV